MAVRFGEGGFNQPTQHTAGTAGPVFGRVETGVAFLPESVTRGAQFARPSAKTGIFRRFRRRSHAESAEKWQAQDLRIHNLAFACSGTEAAINIFLKTVLMNVLTNHWAILDHDWKRFLSLVMNRIER